MRVSGLKAPADDIAAGDSDPSTAATASVAIFAIDALEPQFRPQLSMISRTRSDKVASGNGLAIICMPTSRWPFPKTAFSA